MRRWVFLALISLGVSLAAAADVVPQRKWLQVRSPNFTVMGEAGAGDLRRVAERMEQLHAVLGQIARTSELESPDVTVLVFRTARSFEPFQPRYQGKPVAVAGYFVPGPMNYIAILADRDYDYSDVVHHEYVHLASSRALGSMPPWIGEGLADFFGTFQPTDGGRKARVGQLKDHYVLRLQREFIPLETLTAIDRTSPYYNERDKSSVFYAESWFFFHFLQIAQQRKYAPRLPAFYGAIIDGVPFDRACVEHLGVTPKALESEVRQYLSSLAFQSLEIPLPEEIRRIEKLPATPVSEGEVHAQLAQVLLALREPAAARAQLDHAIAVDPTQALALARLAEQTVTRSPDEALALARRAAAAPNQTFLSAYYRARTLEQVASVNSDQVEPAAIESAWRQVAALNARSGDAHDALGQLRAEARDFDEALALQRRAVQLAPAREDFVLGLARVLIMKGDTKTARSMLGPIVARGSTPAIRQAARDYLGVAAQTELATTGTEAPVPERPPVVVEIPVTVSETPPGPAGSDSAPPPSDPALPARAAGGAGMRYDLHRVRDGEAQVFGTMSAIECAGEAAVLVIATASGPVRVRGEALDRIDFVSFRPDYSGSIDCGPQTQPPPVMVTFRPDRQDDTAGEVVIVEVVPLDFKPPGR